MYIDNNNLLRKAAKHSHWRFNNKGRAVKVFSSSYIALFINEKDKITIDILSNKDLFFPEFLKALYKSRNIKVVYTKLDVGQTNVQLRNNRYFKAFIGDKQIIKEYE